MNENDQNNGREWVKDVSENCVTKIDVSTTDSPPLSRFIYSDHAMPKNSAQVESSESNIMFLLNNLDIMDSKNPLLLSTDKIVSEMEIHATTNNKSEKVQIFDDNINSMMIASTLIEPTVEEIPIDITNSKNDVISQQDALLQNACSNDKFNRSSNADNNSNYSQSSNFSKLKNDRVEEPNSKVIETHENNKKEKYEKSKVLNGWLDMLSSTAELETMSILYAKSVLDPIVSNQLGNTRVALSCKISNEMIKEAKNQTPNEVNDHCLNIKPPEKPQRNVIMSEEGEDANYAPISNENIMELSPTIWTPIDKDYKSNALGHLKYTNNTSNFDLCDPLASAKSPTFSRKINTMDLTSKATKRRPLAMVIRSKKNLSTNDKDVKSCRSKALNLMNGLNDQRLKGGSLSSDESSSEGCSSVGDGNHTFSLTHTESKDTGKTIVADNNLQNKLTRLTSTSLDVVSNRNVLNVWQGGKHCEVHQKPMDKNSKHVLRGPVSCEGELESSISSANRVIVYKPKIELRPSRRIIQNSENINTLFVKNTPPVFRHSIRVNCEDPVEDDGFTLDAFSSPHDSFPGRGITQLSDSSHRNHLVTVKQHPITTENSRIYETIAEANLSSESDHSNSSHFNRQSNYFAYPRCLNSSSPNSASTFESNNSGATTADSGQCSGVSVVGAQAGITRYFSPPLPPRRENFAHGSLITERPRKIRPGLVQNEDFSFDGYIQIANIMDHILRTANVLNSILMDASSYFSDSDEITFRFAVVNGRPMRETAETASIYIRLIRESICARYFENFTEFEPVLRIIKQFEISVNSDNSAKMRDQKNVHNSRDYFTIVTRKMLEQSMIIFTKIICAYLKNCSSTEHLLPMALEHFIQVILFGDDICLEAIKENTTEQIMTLIRMPSTPRETLKLLLRSLSMLCATSKGCLQLLSIDGSLNIIIGILCDGYQPAQNSTKNPSELIYSKEKNMCSVEAAGVLTQLTHPNHAYVKLSNDCLSTCVRRLLRLIDTLCYTSQCCNAAEKLVTNTPNEDTLESLLLCTAALANLSLDPLTSAKCFNDSNHAVRITELLYQYNAPMRLIGAVKAYTEISQRNGTISSPLFVKEQIVTILSRMANHGYSQALIAQGSISFLLHILSNLSENYSEQNEDLCDYVLSGLAPPNSTKLVRRQNSEFCRRICYKTAVCLGMLASTSAGLKALYDSRGYNELCELIKSEERKNGTSPLLLICSSLKQRLESTYQVESAV